MGEEADADWQSGIVEWGIEEAAPEVTCYICKQTFKKRVMGAAHNRNYYRCAECLKNLQRAATRRRRF